MKIRILPEKDKKQGKSVTLKVKIWSASLFKAFILGLVMMAPPFSLSLQAEEAITPKNDITLSEALHRLSQKYEVFFSYDETLIEHVKVNYQPEKYKDVEHALDQSLSGTALKYKVFENRYIILYEESKEAITSLKGMVRHLEAVIDSQEKIALKQELVDQATLFRDSINKRVAMAFTLSGTVTDDDGEPLIGVNVQVKGTNKGTATDVKGKFTIKDIDENTILVFSYIGYQTQELLVKGESALTIAMSLDTQMLDETVVIGYGTQKLKNVTGSITTLHAKSIENQSLTNAGQALQGAKGLYVQQTSGLPGAEGVKLHIRGIGTLNSTSPLVLIDGSEGSLSNLNPKDIESVSVLKDAASTAIYGSRAANGVVLVTTKSGHKGKAQIEYNYEFGLQEATTLPDMVTNSVEYMKARNLAAINEGVSEAYSSEQIKEFETNPDPYLNPNSDFISHMFGTAPIQNHNVVIGGGAEKIDYRFSLGYLDQKGIMIGSNGAKKYLLRSSVNYNITERIKIGSNLAFTYRKNEESSNTTSTTVNYAFKALPIQPITLEDGRYAVSWVKTPHAVSPINAAAIATDEGYIKNKDYNTKGDFYADFLLPANMEFNVQFGFDKGQSSMDRFIPITLLYNPIEPETPLTEKYSPSERSSIFDSGNYLNTTLFTTLKWDGHVNDHNINALGGFSSLTFNDTKYGATTRDFLGNGLKILSGGTTPFSASGRIDESRLLSLFGRVDYDFQEKYLFQFNMRYDGSSKFARNHRWGFFPSFSLGWRLIEEDFLKDVDFLSDLKLRASWGRVGNNAISDFAYLSTISTGGIYTFNNNVVPTAAINAFNDPNITWETTTKRNLGLDFGLWGQKLTFNVDFFSDKTEDILTRISIPEQVGDLSGPLTNFYAMSNQGMEIGADFIHQVGQLKINIGGQFTYVQNKVDFIDGNVQTSSNEYGDLRIIQEGYPVNSFLLYKSEGIFQDKNEIENHAYQGPNTAPGDVKYADVNGDKVIDSKDRIIIGRSSIPKNTYSFNLGFDFKGISLNAFFQGVEGINAYPVQNVSIPLFNGAGITKFHLNNSWTENNRNAKFPRLMEPKHGSRVNFKNSTLWLQDASYMRLKNLRIGYLVPEVWTKGLVESLRLYLSGQNLFTVTDFPKYGDPENVTGVGSLYVYPMLKSYTIGVDIKF